MEKGGQKRKDEGLRWGNRREGRGDHHRSPQQEKEIGGGDECLAGSVGCGLT